MIILDLVLVPPCICFPVLYHVYLWHNKNTSHHRTSSTTWFAKISKEKERGGSLLGAQSIRNSVMSSILNAMVTVIVIGALASLSNIVYTTGGPLHRPMLFGFKTSGTLVLFKYGMVMLLFLASFVFNSIAVGCVNDANFLLSADDYSFQSYAEVVMEKGSIFASVGNRLFYIGFPFLMWLFGPTALSLSMLAMIWVLYNLDFK
ncbi:hypothetical protein ZOSMA_46G00330 [Zostera marina]|uniref:DUF599 domain-containing protein n=1 Tax=Zostera marina TaxID=29655 RepID=A0A0K9P055_ZOSMR|nr:hypothetical protein ZOSMA_46G00330 [Zostera marina]